MGKEAHINNTDQGNFFIFQGKGEILRPCLSTANLIFININVPMSILCISNLHFIFLYLRHLTYVLLLVLQEPVIFMQVFYWGMFLRPTPIRQGGNYGRLETEVGV